MNRSVDIILEEWKTCVEMANSISQRRDTFNNIFITINTAIMSLILLNPEVNSVLVSLIGIFSLVFWMVFITNFKKLNIAKFKVIFELEKKLPYKPFTKEWEYAKNNKYVNGTTVEIGLIIVLFIVYLIIIVSKLKGV